MDDLQESAVWVFILMEISLWNEVGFIDKFLLKFVVDSILKDYYAESWGGTCIFTFELYCIVQK